MRVLFADSSFFIAALNESDVHHHLAAKYTIEFTGNILTTLWVLVEVANFYSNSRRRATAAAFIDAVVQDPKVECVAATAAAFEDGWAFL
jgi:predicted nucleic acid-binding protein